MQQLAEWAKPFIVDLATLCLPEILVEFRKKFNSQEEKKDELSFRDTLIESLQQFSDIVSEVE